MFADDEHLGAVARRVQRQLRRLGEVGHQRAGVDLHALVLRVLVNSGGRVRRFRAGDGGVGRLDGRIEGRRVVEAQAAWGEPLAPGDGAEGGGHQQGVAARLAVRVEQRLDNAGHVGVGGVRLVHDQEVAGEAGGAHMGVAHLERAHHRLVDGSDGNLGGEEALGALGRPRALGVVVLVVLGVVLRERGAVGVRPGRRSSARRAPPAGAPARTSSGRTPRRARGVAWRRRGWGARSRGRPPARARTSGRSARAPPPSCRSRSPDSMMTTGSSSGASWAARWMALGAPPSMCGKSAANSGAGALANWPRCLVRSRPMAFTARRACSRARSM